MKNISFSPLPVSFVLLFLIGILGGILIYKKYGYEVMYKWIIRSACFVTCLLVSYVVYTINFDWFGIRRSLFPLTASICSMILGIYLLRKHDYFVILPWLMSGLFLTLTLLLLGIGLLAEKGRYWILGVLFNMDMIMVYLTWVSKCTLGNFICSFFFAIYIRFKKKKSIYRLKYRKKYLKSYLYVAGLPSAVFLIIWLQYNMLHSFSDQHILWVIVQWLLAITSSAVLFYIKLKTKTKSKFRICIYVIVNFALLVYLTKNAEYISMIWMFLYYLLCFIVCMLYEVKKNQQEDIEDGDNIEKMCFNQYIPLIAMVVSITFIVACSRAYLF